MEQTRYNVSTPLGLGSNKFNGGNYKRTYKQGNKHGNKQTNKQSNKRRHIKGGSALLSEAFNHIPSDSPYNVIRDGVDTWHGKSIDSSSYPFKVQA